MKNLTRQVRGQTQKELVKLFDRLVMKAKNQARISPMRFFPASESTACTPQNPP